MSRGAARLSDVCTGHGCFPTRPNVQGSPNVYINGRPAHRQGDQWASHCCPNQGCHPSVLAMGSPTVYTNGKQQGRINDPVACGSKVMTGSSNVFVGEAGDMPAPQAATFIEQALLIDEPEEDNGVVVMPRRKNPSREDIQQSIANGYNPYAPAPTPRESNTEPGAPPPAVPANCGDLQAPFTDSTQLTNNFTLGQVSTRCALSHYTVVAQHGLSEAEIVCNLKALCENVLEPLKAKGYKFIITSAFRTAQGLNESGNVSQHESGMACDLQFQGLAGNQDYYELANKLKSEIAYDQMILEYGGRNPWIHISFSQKGNRASLKTRMTAGKYLDGLHLA